MKWKMNDVWEATIREWKLENKRKTKTQEIIYECERERKKKSQEYVE